MSPTRALIVLFASLCVTACIYRIDVQQGNLLEDSDVEQVEVGMTRSQVQFLLGTPMVADSFHRDRWDYTYYLRHGKSREVDRRWLIVYFENERVARVDREVELQPAS
jgi:outer membrane protein assembly factor BamE